MPSYSYVTPYQGQQVAPLPTGYMEAATAPGRNIAAGISKLGENVTGLVKEYIKNKREDEYATSKIESMLAQYAGATQGPPTADGSPAGIDQLAGIIGQKNLDAFVSGKANRMQKLAIANSLETYGAQQHQRLQNEYLNEQLKGIQGQQQHQRLQNEYLNEQLGAMQEQRRQQKALVDIQKAVAGLPTTTSTTGEVTTTVPGEFVASTEPQDTSGVRSVTETALAKGFLARAGVAAKQLSDAAAADIAASKQLNISPEQIQKFVPRATPAYGFNAPLGTTVPVETPEQAAIRAEQNLRVQEAAQAKAKEIQAQADILSKASARGITPPAAPQPPKMIQLPPTTKTTSETVVKPVDPEQYRKQIAQEFANRGIPVTPELLNQTAQIAGVQLPIQIQTLSVPGAGTIVKMDGKEQLVPINQEAQRHLIATSIDIPGEVTAQFRTTQDREKFSEDLTTYKQINTSVNNLNSIIDKYPGFSGKIVRSLSPTVGAEISANLDTLKSHLNKPITGGGNLSETDYKRINEVIRDPSKFFTMDSATRTKLLGLSKTAKSKLENQFKATTVQGSLNLGGSQPYNQGGAMKTLTYNPVTKSME